MGKGFGIGLGEMLIVVLVGGVALSITIGMVYGTVLLVRRAFRGKR